LLPTAQPRTCRGDEFDDLQRARTDNKQLGIKWPLPRTNIGMTNRPGMSPDEAKVFEMDLGELHRRRRSNVLVHPSSDSLYIGVSCSSIER
jgi:hypothetical protein